MWIAGKSGKRTHLADSFEEENEHATLEEVIARYAGPKPQHPVAKPKPSKRHYFKVRLHISVYTSYVKLGLPPDLCFLYFCFNLM